MAQIGANERAWLDTIAKAEGTYFDGGAKGYRTMFGYQGELDTNKAHPDRVIRSGGYASAAAGRYQFMPGTWGEAVKALKLDGRMTPQNQDQAALYLMRRRGVDPSQPISAGALNKLAPEWASLPTSSGNSYYGQPVKGRDELTAFFKQRLGAAPNAGNGDIAGAAPAPAPAAPISGGGSAIAGLSTAGMGGVDLSALLTNGGGSITGAAPALARPRSSVAAAILSQQQDLLSSSRPMLASRRAQGVSRMAGSPGRNFMQQLLALTQRPDSLLA